LLLGLSILRRDRKKEERAQAARVAIFSQLSLEGGKDHHGGNWDLRLRTWNHSDAPLFNVLPAGFTLGMDLILVSDEEWTARFSPEPPQAWICRP
jgi:hypothetical protein